MTIWYYDSGKITRSKTDVPKPEDRYDGPLRSSKVYERNRSFSPKNNDDLNLERRIESGTKPKEIVTVSRTDLPSSRRYKKVFELDKQRRETKDKTKRKKINSQLREHRRNASYKDPGFRRVFDLQGNIIGSIVCVDEEKDSLRIADDSYVTGMRFDFVSNENSSQEQICLRTSAYLNDSGKKEVERFVVKFFRRKRKEKSSNQKYFLSKSEAKRRIGHRKAFDFQINDYDVHASMNGKIEIFTLCPGYITQKLASQPCDKYRNRFNFYTRFTPFKNWVGHTNEDINEFIGLSFEGLSNVLGEILR